MGGRFGTHAHFEGFPRCSLLSTGTPWPQTFWLRFDHVLPFCAAFGLPHTSLWWWPLVLWLLVATVYAPPADAPVGVPPPHEDRRPPPPLSSSLKIVVGSVHSLPPFFAWQSVRWRGRWCIGSKGMTLSKFGRVVLRDPIGQPNRKGKKRKQPL